MIEPSRLATFGLVNGANHGPASGTAPISFSSALSSGSSPGPKSALQHGFANVVRPAQIPGHPKHVSPSHPLKAFPHRRRFLRFGPAGMGRSRWKLLA